MAQNEPKVNPGTGQQVYETRIPRVNSSTGKIEYVTSSWEEPPGFSVTPSPYGPLDPTQAAGGFISLIKKLSGWFWGLLNGLRVFIPEYVGSACDMVFAKLNEYGRRAHKDDYANLHRVLVEELGMTERSVLYAQWWYDNVPILAGIAFFFIALYGQICSMSAEMIVIKSKVLQLINKENPTVLPEPAAIYAAILKGYISGTSMKETLDRLGLTPEARLVYLNAIKQLAPPEVLFQNFWRGEITRPELMKELARQGYDTDQAELWANTVERIPPIPDLIRMSVREAFSDELSARFGHDEEFPEDVADWSARQGMPGHWARRYWRAHWELPSVSMGFEMMHRRIISPEEMEALLKMQDYPTGWRKNLMEMSYNPLGRVDIRRMYKMGVFDDVPGKTPEQAIYEKYLDLGYSPENAKYMVDFTVKEAYEANREISVAGLKRLYIKGLLSEKDLRSRLIEMKTHEQDIDLIIAECNFIIDGERIDAWISMAKAKYINGKWRKADIVAEAAKKNIPLVSVDNLTESWDYEKEAVRRKPTKADIVRLFSKGMYGTPEDAIRGLEDLGYTLQAARGFIEEAAEDIYFNVPIQYKIGMIKTREEAKNRLIEGGYKAEDADKWLNENWKNIAG